MNIKCWDAAQFSTDNIRGAQAVSKSQEQVVTLLSENCWCPLKPQEDITCGA